MWRAPRPSSSEDLTMKSDCPELRNALARPGRERRSSWPPRMDLRRSASSRWPSYAPAAASTCCNSGCPEGNPRAIKKQAYADILFSSEEIFGSDAICDTDLKVGWLSL